MNRSPSPCLLVVTPTLGRCEFLTNTLASVAQLPVAVIHVLVAPADILPSLAGRRDGIRLLAEPEGRKGMYAAINAALRADVGEWTHFTYINDDDVLEPGDGSYWREALARDPGDAVVSYGRVRLLDDRSNEVGSFPVSLNPAAHQRLWRLGKPPCYQMGTVVSRAAMDRAGLFDESLRYAGDMDHLLNLLATGCRFHASARTVAAFRLRAGQLSSHRERFDEEIARVRKRWHADQELPWGESVATRCGFFMSNLPSYFDHVRRHGLRRRAELFQ
jgi:hypothetical protein